MASVERSVLIECGARQMFELVDRVEDYPIFLPWCSGTEMIERNELWTVARICINFHGATTHFSTENSKVCPNSMTIRLRDGPFKHLDGEWTFTQLGSSACKVKLSLHYEFSNKLLEKMFGRVFGHIAGTLVESFVNRARQIYC